LCKQPRQFLLYLRRSYFFNLIRDLDLTKSKAELLGSRLQQWNLLKENVRISVYRQRHEDLVQFFKLERGLVACIYVDGLTQTLNINHNHLDWRLSIDLSKWSLKAVILYSGNTITSIPVGHSVDNNESY
jgi:outer membrane cobalamin receptor